MRLEQAAIVAGWAVQHSTWATGAACTHAGRVGSWPPLVGPGFSRRGVMACQQAAVTAAGCCSCLLYLVCNAVHMLCWHHLASPYRVWHAGVESRRPGKQWVWDGYLGWCCAGVLGQQHASQHQPWEGQGGLVGCTLCAQPVHVLVSCCLQPCSSPPTWLLPTGCVCQQCASRTVQMLARLLASSKFSAGGIFSPLAGPHFPEATCVCC